MKKIIALLLAAVLLLSLAGCGEKKGLFDLDGLGGGLPGEELPTIQESATPAQAFEMAMLAMMDVMKAESQSIGMDLTGAFGMPTRFMSLPSYDMTMTYEFEDDGDHESMDGRFISMTNGADAMLSFSMGAAGESMDAATYFTGNDVLVRRADRSLPLVRYTIPDGAALTALQPLHRFRAVLSEDHPEWLSGTGWDKYKERIAQQVQEHADEVTAEERAVTAGALEAQGDAYILKLSGEAAAAMAEQLRGAWLADIQIRTFLTMAENGVNSHKADGYILDQYFDVFNGTDPSLSIAVSAVDGTPASMACYMESSGGRLHITVSKLTQGDAETSQLSAQVFGASSPSGGGYRFLVENARTGKDPVNQDNTQTIFAPDGSERLMYITHSELTGTEDRGSSTFTYTLQDGQGDDATAMTSSGTFSHEKNGSVIDATFSGTMSMTGDDMDDDQTVYSYHGTLKADEKEGQIDIPQFLDASGVSAASRQEFSDILSPGGGGSTPFNGYEKEGAYSQVLYAFAYMIGES